MESVSLNWGYEIVNSIGAENILNSLIFLFLDLFIVFVIINSILSWQDNKRWAPLRHDVFLQSYNLVLLIFHAARSALKRNKSSSLDSDLI